MARAKQPKSKPKKPQHVKKQVKEGDLSQFRAQLDAMGLKIIQVTADGNCFFRALADQLEGNEDEYSKYRSMVVQYIVKNREMFEPFIEDDVPFDQYCESMEKDGTWAGHMELQAASLVTRSNICIHRHMSPRWYVRNFEHSGAHMVHLSYHDEEHYNSVRLKEDSCEGPARPVVIKADGDLSVSSNQAKAASSKSRGGAGTHNITAGAIKLVMAGSGCENAEKVEQVLRQVDGDADAGIEFLIAEQGAQEQLIENGSGPTCVGTSFETGSDKTDGSSEQHSEELAKKMSEQETGSSCHNLKQDHNRKSSSKADDKKIPRNKVCPCGSKKKYKACCGTSSPRPSAKLIVQAIDSKKGRKDRKNCRRGPIQSSEIDAGPPDVGALCI